MKRYIDTFNLPDWFKTFKMIKSKLNEPSKQFVTWG